MVKPVAGRRDFNAFLDVPARLRTGDPTWIAPLRVERKHHFGPKNPYFAHAKAQYFLAETAEGKPVGRITAQVDDLVQPADGSGRVAHFGCLEAADAESLHALLAAAEDWARDQGATSLHGPFSLSINDEIGLRVAGFHRPARLMMNDAPEWYAPAVADAGYAKAKDVVAYTFDGRADLPARAARLAAQAEAMPGLRERPIDPARFHEELATVVDIFNDAWSDNWGFVPMTEAEVGAMAAAMKPLIRPEMVRIAEKDGVPVAMIVGLPDINEALAGLGGRLLPWGWARLLWRLKVRGVGGARVLLMGVRKDYRTGLMGGALATWLIARLHAANRDAAKKQAGFREIELSWVLEDNTPTRRLIENIGGVCDARYRLYEKALT